MGYQLSFTDLEFVVTKDGDTYSDGEIYYQFLIDGQIVSANSHCYIVPDGSVRLPVDTEAKVRDLTFQVELRIDEIDCRSDDHASGVHKFDLSDARAPSRHSIRAVGAEGRLDCTMTFTVAVENRIALTGVSASQ